MCGIRRLSPEVPPLSASGDANDPLGDTSEMKATPRIAAPQMQQPEVVGADSNGLTVVERNVSRVFEESIAVEKGPFGVVKATHQVKQHPELRRRSGDIERNTGFH